VLLLLQQHVGTPALPAVLVLQHNPVVLCCAGCKSSAGTQHKVWTE
jgi:hypothetical protein